MYGCMYEKYTKLSSSSSSSAVAVTADEIKYQAVLLLLLQLSSVFLTKKDTITNVAKHTFIHTNMYTFIYQTDIPAVSQVVNASLG